MIRHILLLQSVAHKVPYQRYIEPETTKQPSYEISTQRFTNSMGVQGYERKIAEVAVPFVENTSKRIKSGGVVLTIS